MNPQQQWWFDLIGSIPNNADVETTIRQNLDACKAKFNAVNQRDITVALYEICKKIRKGDVYPFHRIACANTARWAMTRKETLHHDYD